MATILLTSNERNLICQIQEEIEQMYKQFDEYIETCDKTTDEKEQERMLEAAYNRSKGIKQRSETRESIIRDAINRMKHP